MKTTSRLILRLVLSLAIGGASLSALAKTTSDDFNSLIEENETAQKQLSKDLEKQLNTAELRKIKKPDFKKVGEDVLGHGTVENVASDTSAKPAAKTQAQRDLEKKNFHRLSEELKELK